MQVQRLLTARQLLIKGALLALCVEERQSVGITRCPPLLHYAAFASLRGPLGPTRTAQT